MDGKTQTMKLAQMRLAPVILVLPGLAPVTLARRSDDLTTSDSQWAGWRAGNSLPGVFAGLALYATSQLIRELAPAVGTCAPRLTSSVALAIAGAIRNECEMEEG
jgi:hypothetical protein